MPMQTQDMVAAPLGPLGQVARAVVAQVAALRGAEGDLAERMAADRRDKARVAAPQGVPA